MTTEHTPVPWRRRRPNGHKPMDVDAYQVYASGRRGEVPVAMLTYTGHEDANAAFIVTACNSHDALVEQRDDLLEALKETLGFIDSLTEYKSLRLNPKEAARAALAKAEPPQTTAAATAKVN